MIGAFKVGRFGAVLLSICLAGCGVWNRATSSPVEYDAFRVTRMGVIFEDRLRAAQIYLAKYPDGRFAKEVRDQFDKEEHSFYEASSVSIGGLDWYLTVLPNGPHSVEASLRRAQLREEEKALGHDELVEKGRQIERKLRRADRSRQVARETFQLWIDGALRMRAWGQPTTEMPIALISALRLGDDPGRCRETECTRSVVIPFQLPVQGGGLEDRALVQELVLRLNDEGGVTEVVIRGPGLFTRLWEAEKGHVREPDPDIARANAVGWALEHVAKTVEDVVPADKCDRPITPPVVFLRSCDGWYVDIEVGADESQDDMIRFRGPAK